MSKDNILKLEEIMIKVSNMRLEKVSNENILLNIEKECVENDIDARQIISDVSNIHDLLEEQGASRKKIERVMEKPLSAYDKYIYICLVKSFILDIKNYAYENMKSEDIKKKLEKKTEYNIIMLSKNKSLIALRKSIPKLVKIVREMKAKDKTEKEIINFLYKHLFSYIKF